MKTHKISAVFCNDCEWQDWGEFADAGRCSACEYNCGYKYDVEGNLCVECGYNKDLSLKQNSNEGTRKTNGR